MRDEAIAGGVAPSSLAGRLLQAVEAGVDADSGAFDRLALEVFAHQYGTNAAYREFCDASGASPAGVGSWRDIPAYPTDAFKHSIVASFPFEDAVMAQLTSGTTSPNQRGRIFRDEAGRALVFAANRVMTGACLFPDFERGRRCRILILAPGPDTAPSMGMAIGMEETRRHFGTPDSAFLVDRRGVRVKALVSALRTAEESGAPVALIGATSAFVYFLKAARRRRMRFGLPPESRVCDGGGYRGRFGEVPRDDYHQLVEDVLGVPERMCVNVLGLAESATNYFDDTLRNHVLGRPRTPRRKVPPPWTRTDVVSAETGEVLPPGEVGLLRHFDLANLPTVIAVQSDNLGAIDGRGGFEIVGRAKVVGGKVSPLPSDVPVGPMGDRRVFRLLEAYVNFSIDFGMGRVRSDAAKANELELRTGDDAAPSCPLVVDDLVAGTDDATARERARRALEPGRGEGSPKGQTPLR